MIPKVIHYVWLGGAPLPDVAVRCIDSWKRNCPDFEIKRWGEEELSAIESPYFKEALAAKKWAFACDYARLWIIQNNGGIYLDTDVEVLKPFDSLMQHNAFIGEEDPGVINTGLGFGSEANSPLLDYLLAEYKGARFMTEKGPDQTPCPTRNTRALEKMGYAHAQKPQEYLGCTVYPTRYFSPTSFETGVTNVTSDTFTIHHYAGSWLSEEDRIMNDLRQKIKRKAPFLKQGHIHSIALKIRSFQKRKGN